jgi:glycosyltransferase involved in cell wall biosynthesis
MTESGFLAGAGEPGLVSVIVPTYNRAGTVTTAVDSILASSYANVEAIVVDDGSTDDTPRIMAKYNDPRVRYFRTKNGGMSAARNYGLDRARGEYIAFLDSDDAWMPWKLAAQIELLRRHPEVSLVWTDMSAFERQDEVLEPRYLRTYYTAYQHVDVETVLTRRGSLRDLSPDAPAEWLDAPYYTGSVFREMFMGSLVHPSTAVVRRDRLRAAGNFDFALTGPGAEDYHFYYKISELGPVALLDAPTALYRIDDPLALSKSGLKQARGNLAVLSYWRGRERPALPAAMEHARIAGAYSWLGTEELYEGEVAAARPHLWRALRLKPNARLLVRFAVSLMPKPTLPALRRIRRFIKGNSVVRLLMYAMIVEVALIHVIVRGVASLAHHTRHFALVR